MTSPGWTVDQTSHRLVCDLLRGVLSQLVQARPGAVEEIGSVLCRAGVVVYTLLLDHPIDRRGRCRSCRRPGTIIGLRRRPCRIYLKANYWLLRQPDEAILRAHLIDDLGVSTAPGAGPAKKPAQGPRPHRVPPPAGQLPTSSGGSLMITGGMPWPR